jgi:hypothetical protein
MFITKDVKIKTTLTTLRIHLTLVKMAIIKMITINIGENMGEKIPYNIVTQKVNYYNDYEKQYEISLNH